MGATLLAVPGLETTSQAFRRRLVAVAKNRSLNADFLAAVMSRETAGTFRPDIRAGGKPNGAVGLIQFTKSTEPTVGKTKDELAKMSAVEQLTYVDRYFKSVLGSREIYSLADHYLAVFAPRYLGANQDTVIVEYDEPSGAYSGNSGLDKDPHDGHITVGEAVNPVIALAANAAMRPRLPVSEGSSAFLAFGDNLFFLITAAIGAYHVRRRAA